MLDMKRQLCRKKPKWNSYNMLCNGTLIVPNGNNHHSQLAPAPPSFTDLIKFVLFSILLDFFFVVKKMCCVLPGRMSPLNTSPL